MIFFDVTKTGGAGHRSGLTRVSTRLREELGSRVTEAAWKGGRLEVKAGRHALPGPDDWFLSTELFSEEERPGFTAFIESQRGRTAALFHDAIPLKHPHITWPQSVARHPGYMKLLARFAQVWAVSHASREELLGFWRWVGVEQPPPVVVLPLGADFNRTSRVVRRSTVATQAPQILMLGIIEPRKNQSLLLEVCAELWREGVQFGLHVVGRVNPHFGKPVVTQLKHLRRQHPALLQFHERADDAELADLYRSAHATVFPTMAEGCGLPLLESLWMGVPCVCSDLPVLRENAEGGGCLTVTASDAAAWKAALRRIVSDAVLFARLTTEATSRKLPTWGDAAQILADAMG